MTVTVKELRAMLEVMPDDLIVVTAGDDEGNSFRLLYDDAVVLGQWDERDHEFSSYGYDEETDDEVPLRPEECNAVCIW